MRIKRTVFLLLFSVLGIKGAYLDTSLGQIFEQKGFFARQRNPESIEFGLFVLPSVAKKVQEMAPLKKIQALVRVTESFSPDLYFKAVIEKKEQNLLWVYPPASLPGLFDKAFIGSPAIILPGFEVGPGLIRTHMLELPGKKDIQGKMPKKKVYPMPKSIQITFTKNAKSEVKKVVEGRKKSYKTKVFVSRPLRPQMFFHAVVEHGYPGVIFIYPEQPMPTFKERLKGRKGQVVYGYKVTQLDDETRVVSVVTPHHKGFLELGKRKGVHELYPPQKPVASAPPLQN